MFTLKYFNFPRSSLSLLIAKFIMFFSLGVILTELFPIISIEINKIFKGEIQFYEKYLWLSSITINSFQRTLIEVNDNLNLVSLFAPFIYYYSPIYITGIIIALTIIKVFKSVFFANTLMQLVIPIYKPTCWILSWLTLSEINRVFNIEKSLVTIYLLEENNPFTLYFYLILTILLSLIIIKNVYVKILRFPYDIIKKQSDELKVNWLEQENKDA